MITTNHAPHLTTIWRDLDASDMLVIDRNKSTFVAAYMSASTLIRPSDPNGSLGPYCEETLTNPCLPFRFQVHVQF
jgi:hypothetical protein